MIDFDIVMLVPGMSFNGNTVKEASLGGSESAAFYMAQALARKGQHVTVFSTIDTPSTDEAGVRYLPMPLFSQYTKTTGHDICIVQRGAEAFSNIINSRLNLLWCHDLALGRQADRFRGVLWNVDAVMVLSDFMAAQYKKVFQLPDHVLFQTRNGIDIDSFPKPLPLIKRSKRLLYAARPERGLDILLKDIMPKIWERDPDIQLRIATYDNPQSQLGAFYDALHRVSDIYGDKVAWLGALNKADLYDEMNHAYLYAYPTPGTIAKDFAEVSCIAAMEAQACGLPIVTSAKGALKETIHPDAGFMIEGDAWTEEYQKEFVDAVFDYFDSDYYWNASHDAGIKRALELSWDDVADDWLCRFEEMIRERNDSNERLLRHCWRTSDIVLAKHVLAQMQEKVEAAEPTSHLDELFRLWDFMEAPDGYRKQYEEIPEEIPCTKEAVDTFGRGSRYEVCRDFIKEQQDEIRTVLDYGCSYGEYPVGLARDFPGIRTVGVDIDHTRRDLVMKFAELAGVSDRVSAHVADVAGGVPLPPKPEGGYDIVLAQEILEHVTEPWKLIEAVEAEARDNGWVYITVPFGAWEYLSYPLSDHRCHVWHFDMHDIRDMVGKKEDLRIDAMFASINEQLGTPLGWWVVKYRKTGVPTGRINMNRKAWLQRPRQTVSAVMMAGPNSEDTLHWCMKSFQHIADELVLVDNGMEAESLRIAAQYNARIVPGIDPRVYGFEMPRNIGLDAARMDWVFWIDTDEKVINQINVHKYLRENMFNGYGVRQHHFACDTSFNPDMPVRFFRKKPTAEGKAMRFYGMIHEHPEIAINEGPGTVVVLADAHIAHVGYLVEATRQARFVRNYPLLLKDQEVYPGRILQKHFIMRDNIILCRYELESNGGRLTRDIEQRCREVIRLYREYFLGKKVYMGADSLQYYSDALSILGEGAEVAFQFDASKDTADPNAGVARYRFASRDDFVIEITKRVDDKFSVIEDPNY